MKESVINYFDKYGNLYEKRTIVEKNGKVKNKIRTINYAPFKTRFHIIIITAGMVGFFSYMLTKNYIPIIYGLSIYAVLTLCLEIYYKTVNRRYKNYYKKIK